MHVNADHSFPVVRVGDISSEPNTQRWLVDELWGASSVGVIGGAPKCAKTWLGLDMALSVATGTACLGKYAVPQPGPVLVYLAEDALLIVRAAPSREWPGIVASSSVGGDPRDHGACAAARSRSRSHAAP